MLQLIAGYVYIILATMKNPHKKKNAVFKSHFYFEMLRIALLSVCVCVCVFMCVCVCVCYL